MNIASPDGQCITVKLVLMGKRFSIDDIMVNLEKFYRIEYVSPDLFIIRELAG